MQKYYTQNPGKVIEGENRFKHLMAITLSPAASYREGIVRCIVSRTGDPALKSNTDRSELFKLKGNSLEHFEVTERLQIKNEKEILEKVIDKDGDFLGLEDPDIWVDKDTNLMHVYFTIPVTFADKSKKTKVHLGHAVGPDLNSLEMTMPVLIDTDSLHWAKEVSIVPLNKKGFRYNLIESKDRKEGISYSTVRVAIASDMSGPWEFGETVFHPNGHNIPWILGHASPGPLFSKNFIDVGEGKLLGVINGREINQKVGDQIKYGIFSVGLFVFDYENGKIDFVSPEPFIIDTEAKNITFASQFVETKAGEGILYAHVDDSFVRSYSLSASGIRSFLAKFGVQI